MITITGLDDFPTAIAALPLLLDDGRMAIAVTHGATPGTNEIAYSAAYLVNITTGAAQRVGASEPYGKDIAASLVIHGSILYLVVSEAIPGGGGASSQVNIYPINIGVGLRLEGFITTHEARLDAIAAGARG